MAKRKKSTKGAGDNGKPKSPAPTPSAESKPRLPAAPSTPGTADTVSVELNPVEKLAMENLLLKRDLLKGKIDNLKLRQGQLEATYQAKVKALAEETAVLDREAAENTQLRDDFIGAKGFDVSQPVQYVDGVLTGPQTQA